jgi:hypothetical protein
MPDTRHDAVSARPAIVRTRLESNVTVIAVAGELDLMRAGERRPPPFRSLKARAGHAAPLTHGDDGALTPSGGAQRDNTPAAVGGPVGIALDKKGSRTDDAAA